MPSEIIFLGPYRQGEIPPPITLTFEDSTGTPIPLASPFVAKLEYRRWGDTTVVERTATIAGGQTVGSPTAGQVTYTWVTADMQTAGLYVGELWVGNGTNRYASRRLRWPVESAIQVPAI